MSSFHPFLPLGQRIMVRRLPPEDVTPGGIVIPDAAKEVVTRGKVVAVPRRPSLEALESAAWQALEALDVKAWPFGLDSASLAHLIAVTATSRTPGPGVAVGDLVIFGKYVGSEVQANGETLVILDVADVLACARSIRPVGGEAS